MFGHMNDCGALREAPTIEQAHELQPKKSLSDRYAEVVRLRQAVFRTQAALRAPAGINRLASK